MRFRPPYSQLRLPLLLLALLAAAFCGGCSDEQQDCSEVSRAWSAEVERKNAVIDELQQRVARLKQTLQDKHQEVKLHKLTPELMNQELVAEQQRSKRLEEELDALRTEYERLLTRYSSVQRELQQCQTSQKQQ